MDNPPDSAAAGRWKTHLRKYLEKPRRGALMGTVILLFILLFLWWHAGIWYEEKLVAELEAKKTVELHTYGSTLSVAINNRFALLEGLHAFIMANLSNTVLKTEFETFASGLYTSTSGVRNFAVAPRGVMQYVYPLEGNENVLGHDLINDTRPNVRADVQRSIQTRSIVLSGPYELRQGGQGLVARKALFVNGTFWGLVAMVIDLAPLLEECRVQLHTDDTTLAARDDSGNVFCGNGSVFNKRPVVHRINLPEGFWEIASIPTQGWYNSVRNELRWAQGIGLIFISLFILLVYQAINRDRRLALAVQEKTIQISKANEALQSEITERKRAAEALRQGESFIKSVMDNLPLGIAVNTVSDAVKFEYMNDNFPKIYRTTRAALVDPDAFWNAVYEEAGFREEMKKKVLDDCASGDPQRMYWLDVPITRKGEETSFITAQNIAVPNTQLMISTVWNVTDRRQTEDALKDNEILLNEVGKIAKIGGWEMDLNTRKAKWTKGAYDIVEIEYDQPVPGPDEHAAYYLPEYRSLISDSMQALVEDDRPLDFEAQLRTEKGNIKWCHAIGRAIRKEGRCIKLYGTFQDITERKQMQEELKKHHEQLEELVQSRTKDMEDAQKALLNIVEDINEAKHDLEKANEKLKELDLLKSMFIASMSHELRTPLNSIIGFTGIILQGMAGEINDEQRDQLQRVYRSGKHLLALINDVIDISKIEAAKTETQIEELDLVRVIDQAIETVKTEIEKKDLGLETSVPQGLVLKTDRRRLLQCLLNYLSNAVKFTKKGKISITVREVGTLVDITVTDTGIGIKEEDLPKLFGSFVRIDSPLRIQTEGTGLGLYLTKKLTTDVLKGSVSVESIHGKGSAFTLRIAKDLTREG